MENLHMPIVISTIIIGGLIGLYLYGKRLKKSKKNPSSQPIIKVEGENCNDLVNKKTKGLKNKVSFDSLNILTYETIVTWINEADLKDAQEELDNYGCALVRSVEEIKKFNIDIDSLKDEQKRKLYGAIIINTKTYEVLKQRWIVADSIDDDLLNIFGENNLVILK